MASGRINPVSSHSRDRMRMIPSHRPEPRTTGAILRPTNIFDRNIEGTVEEERFPGSGPNTAQFASALFENMPEFGGGLNAVAGVKPGLIKSLRMTGEDRLNQIARRGLEERDFGVRPTMPFGSGRVPNIQLDADTIDALRIIQRRWPRLWGHLSSITDVDAMVKLRDPGTLGSIGSDLTPSPNPKMSSLGLNYRLGRGVALAKGNDPSLNIAEIVGDELGHAKDTIRYGHEGNLALNQALNKAPQIGYRKNPFELRNEELGKRVFDIVKATRDAGGGDIRARTGKNLRVPITPGRGTR